MTNPIQLSSKGFLRLPQVLKLIPIGKSTWWAGVKSGRFPQPVKLGPKTTMWRVEEIHGLVESMGASRKEEEHA